MLDPFGQMPSDYHKSFKKALLWSAVFLVLTIVLMAIIAPYRETDEEIPVWVLITFVVTSLCILAAFVLMIKYAVSCVKIGRKRIKSLKQELRHNEISEDR
jgi:uncharacterized membrane protein YesL